MIRLSSPLDKKKDTREDFYDTRCLHSIFYSGVFHAIGMCSEAHAYDLFLWEHPYYSFIIGDSDIFVK